MLNPFVYSAPSVKPASPLTNDRASRAFHQPSLSASAVEARSKSKDNITIVETVTTPQPSLFLATPRELPTSGDGRKDWCRSWRSLIWASSREMLESVSQCEIRKNASLDGENMQFDQRGSAKRCVNCSVIIAATLERGALTKIYPYWKCGRESEIALAIPLADKTYSVTMASIKLDD